MLFACKKKYDDVSQVQTATYPTITFTGAEFYSINVGGGLPDIQATAFDSSLGESYPVELTGTDNLDNTKPGLYVVQLKSTNKYGFYSTKNVLVAVTDVSDNVHLEGLYKRTSNSEPVNVTRLARGLYQTDDVGGSPTLAVAAYFVHINDTLIDVPEQPTSAGTLSANGETLTMAPGDTSFSYIIDNPSFLDNRRTFVKQ